MVEIIKSSTFDAWLSGLRDRRAAVRVQVRLDRMAAGHAGDAKPVGGGVSEMRIDHGPGYRVYFMQRGARLVVLLCAGDKSTQAADIQSGPAHCRAMEGVKTMGETFSRYDSAEYLKTEEDIAAYIEAAMDEGGEDPAFIAHALGVVARARNMSQLARDTGMTREGLYKALSGEGNPSFATVVKVARVLGFKVSLQPLT